MQRDYEAEAAAGPPIPTPPQRAHHRGGVVRAVEARAAGIRSHRHIGRWLWLAELLGLRSTDDLVEAQQEWIASNLARDLSRDPTWSESLAVASETFAREIQNSFGARARHRKIAQTSNGFLLREPRIPYRADSEREMVGLSSKNTQFWNPHP